MSSNQFTQLQQMMKASMQEVAAGLNHRIDQLLLREHNQDNPPSNIQNSTPSTISPITGHNSTPSPCEPPPPPHDGAQLIMDNTPTPAGRVAASEDT